MRIGLIGAGAIGRQIMAALGRRAGVEIILLRPAGRAGAGGHPANARVVTMVSDLLAASPACVIEAARQDAVAELLPPLLSHGIPVVLCSTGALADSGLRKELIRLAEQSGAQLVIPGGAVAGLDYLETVSRIPGTRVTYTSRKPPAAWRAELAELGHAPDHLPQPVILFDGTPEEAARRYPRNVNAALTIALAAGELPMTVRVVADPAAAGNTHDIEVRGPAGSARMEFVNAPSPGNPKTSAITALSALRAAESVLQKRGLRFV